MMAFRLAMLVCWRIHQKGTKTKNGEWKPGKNDGNERNKKSPPKRYPTNMVDFRSFFAIYIYIYILDLLKVVGTTKTYSPNGGLMVR